MDQYFAELVLERKQTNPALELIAVIPYRKRLDSLNKKTRTRELLEACLLYTSCSDKVLTLSTCTPGGTGRFLVMGKLVKVDNEI